MDIFVTAVAVFFYGAVVTQAQQILRAGGDYTVEIPTNSSEQDDSRVLALLILEENDSEESGTLADGSYKTPTIMPWIDAAKLGDEDEELDTSGESNSDEYPDSDTSDTDSESSFYHEDDYLNDAVSSIDLAELKHLKEKTDFLRKRWKSCRKEAAKVCREACVVSYKNACDEHECGRRLKKTMKKECKRNCKDLFM